MDVTMSASAPGEAPPAAPEQIAALFLRSYHRYHYLDALASPDRHRFAAHRGGALVGYATARVAGTVAFLANLLVEPAVRGCGIGGAVDAARCAHMRSLSLSLYTSCCCDDAGSQRLKLGQGLRPVAVKFGYRRDVSGPGSFGSAVVYTDAQARVGAAPPPRIERDRARERLRWIGEVGPDGPPSAVAGARGYAEILTGAAGAERLRADPAYGYAGVDLDPVTMTWLHCFQARNAAFAAGLAQRPVVVEAPAGVLIPAVGGAAA